MTSFITSRYLSLNIIASTSERSIKLLISFSGKDLSIGTTIPVPATTAKYETAHSYLFSEITAILLSFKPKLTNAVPKALT